MQIGVDAIRVSCSYCECDIVQVPFTEGDLLEALTEIGQERLEELQQDTSWKGNSDIIGQLAELQTTCQEALEQTQEEIEEKKQELVEKRQKEYSLLDSVEEIKEAQKKLVKEKVQKKKHDGTLDAIMRIAEKVHQNEEREG